MRVSNYFVNSFYSECLPKITTFCLCLSFPNFFQIIQLWDMNSAEQYSTTKGGREAEWNFRECGLTTTQRKRVQERLLIAVKPFIWIREYSCCLLKLLLNAQQIFNFHGSYSLLSDLTILLSLRKTFLVSLWVLFTLWSPRLTVIRWKWFLKGTVAWDRFFLLFSPLVG